MFLPIVTVSCIGVPKGADILSKPICSRTHLLSALPNVLELDLLPQELFYKRITVVSHLPTGRSPASCLSCPNIRARKCTLHGAAGAGGCLSASPARLSQSVSLLVRSWEITVQQCQCHSTSSCFPWCSTFRYKYCERLNWTELNCGQKQLICRYKQTVRKLLWCTHHWRELAPRRNSRQLSPSFSALFHITERDLAQRQKSVQTVYRKTGPEASLGLSLSTLLWVWTQSGDGVQLERGKGQHADNHAGR